MIFSLVAMTGLEKCCITSAYLQWLCHSGERPVARGPLVLESGVCKGKTPCYDPFYMYNVHACILYTGILAAKYPLAISVRQPFHH